MTKVTKLTVFYDSYCPLCMIEMRHLSKRNTTNNIVFEDINDSDFDQRYPELDFQKLYARIHGLTNTGELITGLDVTYHAWRLVGQGWIYAPLRWPIVKPIADRAYNVFARHRNTLSYWLTGKPRCSQCKENL